MTHEQIHDPDTMRAIQQEKEIELLDLHEELFKQEIKSIEEIGLRARVFKCYKIMITRFNVEKYYNMPMALFMDKFWKGEINK